MKEIYDDVYTSVPRYDAKMEYKIDLVQNLLRDADTNTKIIDIGCGKGHYARSIKSWGYDNYTALEFSTACCEQFLGDIPHINADFLDYGPTISDNEYDLTVCMDVLEHISYEKIGEFVSNISRISDKAFLGIANHSDVFLGEELHIIQQGVQWWTSLLSEHFRNVKCVGEASFNVDGSPKFFLFVCE